MKKIFFFGIGGIGMSALALYFHNKGFAVSGFDRSVSEITKALSDKGITVYHKEENVNISEIKTCIYTAAIPEKNTLLNKIKNQKIYTIKRAKALAEIAQQGKQIAISGTHGKTTTTAMTTKIFVDADLNPTSFIGGILSDFETNFIAGDDNIFIIEADEYDRSFHQLNPIVAGINNVDADHFDIYKDEEEIIKSFQEFINKIPFYGTLFLNADEQNCLQFDTSKIYNVITYGMNEKADLRAFNFTSKDFKCFFTVAYKNKILGDVEVPLPGKYNCYNALLSIAFALENNILFETIQNALKSFKGVHRRFEILHVNENQIFIDDYAHHPKEISSLLKGIKKNASKPIIVFFQPHLYSRTKDLKTDFAKALSASDSVYLLPIYPARELPIEGVSSQIIGELIKNRVNVKYVNDLNSIYDVLDKKKNDSAIFVSIGAGNISVHFRNALKKILNGKSL